MPIEKPGNERSERAALREAEKFRTKLLADADALKVARTKATVGALLERWMAQHEIDPTTRMTYEAQIRLYIEPKLGDVPLVLFVREAAERLEPFYAQLRRCRALCNGRPFVEKHVDRGHARLRRRRLQAARLQALRGVERALDPRDPLRRMLARPCGGDGSASTRCRRSGRRRSRVRSRGRRRASRWRASSKRRGQSSPEWGLYIWLSAVLGARRGEVVALQWEDIDLDAGVVRLDENYVRTADGMLLKDTKTHQMRRVSIDAPTVELLRQYRDDCSARLALLGLDGDRPDVAVLRAGRT